MSVQIVGYWDDETEFRYGPFVAVAHPMPGGGQSLYRLEKRYSGALAGTLMVPTDEVRACIPDYEPGWKSLEEITPVVEALNAACSGGAK